MNSEGQQIQDQLNCKKEAVAAIAKELEAAVALFDGRSDLQNECRVIMIVTDLLRFINTYIFVTTGVWVSLRTRWRAPVTTELPEVLLVRSSGTGHG